MNYSSKKAKICAARGCKSNSLKLPNLNFFRFPKKLERAKIWMERVGREDLMLGTFSERRICSLHFEKKDYIQLKRCRLLTNSVPMAIKGFTRIKEDTKVGVAQQGEITDILDTCNEPAPLTATESFVDLSHFLDIKTEVEDIPQLSVKSDPLAFLTISNEHEPNTFRETFLEKVHIKSEPLEVVCAKAPIKILSIKRTANVTALNSDLVVNVKRRKMADLKSIVQILKDKNLIDSGNCDRLEELCKPIIKGISNGTITKLSNQYSPEMRALVLNLNFYSPKAYSYVRSNIIHSLPQPSILCSWFKNNNASPGFTSESIQLISKKVKAMKAIGKDLFFNLVFDEMVITSAIEWTGRNSVGYIDAGDGIENTTAATIIFVLMVVCVSNSWKIPIGFFPNKSMSAEQKANIIIQSIHVVYKTGAKLIGVTCDGRDSNISTAKLLGCGVVVPRLNPTFTVSGIDEELLMVFDPIYLVKLVRNTLADRGPFIDGNNKLVDWNYLKRLLELPEMVAPFSNQRLKLMFASQILSDSVADAVEYCNQTLKMGQFSNSEGTVDFIRICNKVFDILNSRKFYNDGYEKFDSLDSSNFKEIFNFSLYAIKYFSTLKLANEQLLIESIHKTGFNGLILGLKACKILYNKYISKGLLTAIPIYKFSKDHIESFLGLIRRQLRTDKPTVRQFIRIYRKFMIDKCLPLEELPIPQQNKNSSIEFINSTILNKLTPNYERADYYKNLEDLNHLLDLDQHLGNLNEYNESIIAYIAGLVVFSLQTKLKCEECIKLLESNTIRAHSGFTILNSCNLVKNKPWGKLKIASEDVLKICAYTETVLKEANSIHNDLEMLILDKQNYAKILIKSQDLCRSRLLFTNSTHVHCNFLIRGTIEEYLTVRQFYMSPKATEPIAIIVVS